MPHLAVTHSSLHTLVHCVYPLVNYITTVVKDLSMYNNVLAAQGLEH